MKLELHVPAGPLFDAPVLKLRAEAENGHFCLKPRHADFVTALAPGLLECELTSGAARWFAVDRGILVKCGERVSITTRRAIEGPDLERLRATVRERYRELGERETRSRSALARLTASFLRSYLDATGSTHG